MDVKERLKQYLKYKRISQRAFSVSIDVSPAYITNINKSISQDKVIRITKHFPDLNIGWLITGEGDMLKTDNLPTAPTTIENSVLNSGSEAVINNGGDETFWKGLVNELRERIADLKTKCDEKDAQIKAFEELIEEARQENERLRSK